MEAKEFKLLTESYDQRTLSYPSGFLKRYVYQPPPLWGSSPDELPSCFAQMKYRREVLAIFG